MPPPRPPFPVAMNLAFHVCGRNRPKLYDVFPGVGTLTVTAHRLGRFVAATGYSEFWPSPPYDPFWGTMTAELMVAPAVGGSRLAMSRTVQFSVAA
jgi:hypothetical protein